MRLTGGEWLGVFFLGVAILVLVKLHASGGVFFLFCLFVLYSLPEKKERSKHETKELDVSR
jgi:hypothetical protein